MIDNIIITTTIYKGGKMVISKNIKAYPFYLKKIDGFYAVWNDSIPVATQGKTL